MSDGDILRYLAERKSALQQAEEEILELKAQLANARKQTASDIFSLAHDYARQDKAMRGSEELRHYHYFNAISKIGEFDGR